MQSKNGQNSAKSLRRFASKKAYVSPNQLVLPGFETPFDQALTQNNRWVKLSKIIPWDDVVNLYDRQFNSTVGRRPINGRTIIGAVIIKHMLNLTDRETIMQIQENMFMQYFLGYTSFTNEPPFDPSLYVDIRNRLSLEILTSISEICVKHAFENESEKSQSESGSDHGDPNVKEQNEEDNATTHKGKLLMDASVAPQNITYPTDLKVLDAAREKSEQLIDILYDKVIHGPVKPRTYRQNARKDFLQTNKKKRKTNREIIQANRAQLRYLKRNIEHIEKLLKAYNNDMNQSPLKKKEKEYFRTIKKVKEQQQYMLDHGLRKVEDRIVNIHQPQVRPIVRGKEGKKVEFGSKIQLVLIDGYSFIDKLSWDNFNESTTLKTSVENYKKRFGYYPEEVLVDKIYCTRENRAYLKSLDIKLHGKPLGRPKKEAVSNHVSPGERNPVEGKFGQGKTGYGMDNIMAKLKSTSESWIGSIVLVLNLIKLMGSIPLCLLLNLKALLVGLLFDEPKIGIAAIRN